MKRRLLTIAIFLLAGAAVNIAVAWGFALLRDYDDLRSPNLGYLGGFSAPSSPRWYIVITRRSGTTYVGRSAHDVPNVTEVIADHLPAWTLAHQPPSDSPSWGTWPQILFNEIAHGWPLVSMRCTLWSRESQPGVNVLDRITEGFRLHTAAGNNWWEELHVLPLRPIWRGFTVNTLFYAAILWLLIPGPFALRRLIRRRRGLCPACAYDLRHAEHEACPECGLTA